MDSPHVSVQKFGQSIWYDNIRRGLITSGELHDLVTHGGVLGVTSNPAIFEKAIAGSTDYDETLLELSKSNMSAQELFEAFAIEDIRAAADLLRPIYDRTGGDDGYASLEVSPALAHDTPGTIAEAKRLFAALDRPNVMVKVPATPEGIPAIRSLIGKAINVNVTLIFSRDVYQQVAEAYIGGLEHLDKSGGDVSKVASVASFFVSRLDSAVDALLEESIRNGNKEIKQLLGKAAIANAKLAYQDFKVIFGKSAFTALKGKGARTQRPLWASTGAKNPDDPPWKYVESLAGSDIQTNPPAINQAVIESDLVFQKQVDQFPGSTVLDEIDLEVDFQRLERVLMDEGIQKFAAPQKALLALIADKRSAILAT